jgi:methylmalonyl-CoA/ethylmalonyl-CoA epimerase
VTALGHLALDHVGIAVRDLEAASLVYRRLGLTPEGDDEVIVSQAVRVRAFRVGESLLELLEPTAPESPIAVFIEKRGPGLHHLAVRVLNLEAEIIRLKGEGARFIDETPRAGRAGSRVVFLHPKWGEGVLVELVAH